MDIRTARSDAGLTQRALARAAGASSSTLHALERERYDPSTEVLARVGAALGMDLRVRSSPGTGSLIRDRWQAAMIEALLAILHERWRPIPEVWVTRPVKGVVDLLLEPDAVREPLVAVEAQSGLQRLEQQIRWAHAKSEALGEACQRPVSQLLLLRSTRKTRAVATEHVATIRAAYPGSTSAVVEALSGVGAWPGPALVMCDVDLGAARIRPSPPRGVTIGR